jgi:hypothetical protein
MRRRTSPNCRVRQIASPVSPLCRASGTFAQSVVPNGRSEITMLRLDRAMRIRTARRD